MVEGGLLMSATERERSHLIRQTLEHHLEPGRSGGAFGTERSAVQAAGAIVEAGR